jgi:hypothetical protein
VIKAWLFSSVAVVAVVAALGFTGAPASAQTSGACARPTHFGTKDAANVVHLRARHGGVWGLALGPARMPLEIGNDLKIVWRVTGSGPLRVRFVDPNGRHRALTFGPEPHTGTSTFDHPGDEWGTGFHFDEPGCWQIRLARRGVAVTVRLTVSPPAGQRDD